MNNLDSPKDVSDDDFDDERDPHSDLDLHAEEGAAGFISGKQNKNEY
jgi:hypothetical protein